VSALAALGRTLADSADRDSWLAVHDKVIGSSTAGKFAKASSVETYVRQILEPRTFSGNESTRSGNDWEPALLTAVGAEPNTLFVHHPDNERFATTVDGATWWPPLPSEIRAGHRADVLFITEVKTKHNKVVTGPTPYEIRQAAWHLFCIPEAVKLVWAWGEVVIDEKSPIGWRLRRPIQSITFTRDDPRIIAATNLIVPIAFAVLERLDAAQLVRTPF
jgi:hypothetical protein